MDFDKEKKAGYDPSVKMIVDQWLTTDYEAGRHQVRIDIIAQIEKRQKLK